MTQAVAWETDAGDLADAVCAFEAALPGWWWSVGMCSVGAHASCAVDGRGIAAHLLEGIEQGHPFDSGFHADTDRGTPAEALLDVMRQAQDFCRGVTTIPVRCTAVDMTSGTPSADNADNTVRLTLLPPPPDVCQECGRSHESNQPHDPQTLRYQYHHYGQTGRWPTWVDAMAHCPAEIRDAWIDGLTRAGVDVEHGELSPR